MPPADALLKKLSRGGAARPPLPETDALGPVFARGVEDRLRPILGALVAARAEAPRAARLGEAAAAVVPPALVGVAELPGAESPAVVAADFALAWHMTDLTLGADPGGAPSPLARPLTAIDFALGRLHLEAILAALGPALGAGLGRPLPGPLRLAQARQDLAELRLGPERSDALVLRLGVALGAGGRRGAVTAILPMGALDALRSAAGAAPTDGAEARRDDLWRRHMRRTAAAAPAPVEAVLHRQTMSLAAIEALRPGQVLEIPRAATEAIRLCIAQPGGRTATIATGRLGALDDRKVVKLDDGPDPRLIQHLAAALRPPAPPEPAPPTPAPSTLAPSTPTPPTLADQPAS